MNTSYSPQAAADQARSKYRNATVQLGLLGLDTAIPDGVRALAEKPWRRAARLMTDPGKLSMHP